MLSSSLASTRVSISTACALRPRRTSITSSASPSSSSSSEHPREFRANGYLAFEALDASPSSERIKVECGPVDAYTGGKYDGDKVRWNSLASTPPSERKGGFERVYVFDRVLPQTDGASTILSVTQDRPLGIVFEPDADGLVRVADFVAGSQAAKANDVASLAPFGAQCAKRGDVLRGFTGVQVSFKTTASITGDLSGAKRVRTLYGADGQGWGEVCAALTNGRKADGPVTLVLERDADAERRENWPRAQTELEFRGLGEESTKDKRERERLEPTEDEKAANLSILVGVASFLLLIVSGFQ